MKLIILLFFIMAFGASAQVADFLPTQKTISKPFSLPIKIDLDGKINFVTGDRDLVFAPGIQIGFDKTFVQYSLPQMASEFTLVPPIESSGWMEFKRKHYDYGLGLVSVMKKTFRLGLAPYKGARMSMRRLKVNKNWLTTDDIRLPKKLSEMESWSVGDEGSYQTYGGIQVYAGIDVGPVNPISATLGWQNQFIVSVQRTANGITLSVKEEKLGRKSIFFGLDPVNITATDFNGKQLLADFRLDFQDPIHHELYEAALKGEFTRLQNMLTSDRKNLSWRGSDVSFYWGVPFLIGQTNSRGSYHVSEDKQDYFLEVIQNKRSGLLVPTSLQQKFVYHNSESILLMWTTDMKKAASKRLRKHFFSPARAVGFKGFDIEISDTVDYGTVIGEVGVVLTKDDVTKFEALDNTGVSENLIARCSELKLDCAKTGNAKSIMKRFSDSMKEEWDLRKKKLGVLLVKEPALLHALLKESQMMKEAYFKFLSDRYQSLEGLTILVI